MDKTTLYLDSAEYRKLKRIAEQRKAAPASLVREAVAEYVARHATAQMPRSVGAFRSGRGDLSERAEALLDGFGTASPRRRSRGRAGRGRDPRAARRRRCPSRGDESGLRRRSGWMGPAVGDPCRSRLPRGPRTR